jgi:hypothetical protein
MALEMKEAIGELNREWLAKGINQGFEVRMGISTGFDGGQFCATSAWITRLSAGKLTTVASGGAAGKSRSGDLAVGQGRSRGDQEPVQVRLRAPSSRPTEERRYARERRLIEDARPGPADAGSCEACPNRAGCGAREAAPSPAYR